MKRTLLLPTLSLFLLSGVPGLYADTVKGEKAAKIKIEEVNAEETAQVQEDLKKVKKETIKEIEEAEKLGEEKAKKTENEVRSTIKNDSLKKRDHKK